MANIICIMGESGAGKTTSCRNLDPATTFYIDCDKKGLSWKGWRNQYNAENKNYYKTDDQHSVLTLLKSIDKKPETKHIKTVIVAIHKNWELVTVARHRLVQAITVVVATEHQVDACFIQKR